MSTIHLDKGLIVKIYEALVELYKEKQNHSKNKRVMNKNFLKEGNEKSSRSSITEMQIKSIMK